MSSIEERLHQYVGGLARRVDRLETIEKGTASGGGGAGTAVFNDGEGNPANIGTASSDGASNYAARRDHVHTVTGATLLTTLASVDGNGSGLDADLLDGYHAAAFAGTADVSAGTILAKLLTVDGTGTGLDADTLDGYHAADLMGGGGTAVLDWDDMGTITHGQPVGSDMIPFSRNLGTAGTPTRLGSAWQAVAYGLGSAMLRGPAVGFNTSTEFQQLFPFLDTTYTDKAARTTNRAFLLSTQGISAADFTDVALDSIVVTQAYPANYARRMSIQDFLALGTAVVASLDFEGLTLLGTATPVLDDEFAFYSIAGTVARKATIGDALDLFPASDILTKLITADGAGSGLDADLLDGSHASAFAGTADVTAGTVLAKLLTVDGSGSGLDADLLDGVQESALAKLAGATFTGAVSAPSFVGTTSQTIADSGDWNVTSAMGLDGGAHLLYVYLGTDADAALIMARGGGSQTVTIILAVRAGNFSTTPSNAGDLNMYYSGGNLVFQNLRGASRTVTVTKIG